MLIERKITILNELSAAEKPLTSDYLASAANVTSRTVRNDIKELSCLLENHGAEIATIMGKGFQLIIKDRRIFNQLEKSFAKSGLETADTPVLPGERIRYLINRFLSVKGYIKLEDLANELFISESTVKSDLRNVKEVFKNYNIEIEKRPNFGMKVKANEYKLRLCMADYAADEETLRPDILEAPSQILPIDELSVIHNAVLKSLDEHQFVFSDLSVKNLIIHTAVACRRIRSGEYVSIYPETLHSVTAQPEYKIALQIASKLEAVLNLSFSESEAAYITIHLLGMKIAAGQPLINSEIQSVNGNDIYQLTVAILQGIEQKLNLGICGDPDLLATMCMHLKPAINRYYFGMTVKNPMVDEIKNRYPLAFEAGIVAGMVIEQKLKTKIDENEIGYLALHIEAAIERKKIGEQKKRCLIVCASGHGSAKLLSYTIQSRFSLNLEIVGTMEYYRLKQADFSKIDFVISTIPIKEKIPVPVIEVNTFLGENDFKKVAGTITPPVCDRLKYTNKHLVFLQQDFASKEEVIEFLCEKIQKQGLAEKSFTESVFKREHLSPTAFGNLVAVPHPCWPQTESTFWAICTLKKPIKWSGKKVQFVCLLGVMKQNQEDLKEMYNILGKIINSASVVQQLLKCATYEEFNIMLAGIK